jgi:hypothetical protein
MKTYVKIEKKVLDKIEEITNTDYNAEDVYLTTESLIMIIDDLLIELDKLQEKLNDLEENIDTYCYDKTHPYQFYGVNERDFV